MRWIHFPLKSVLFVSLILTTSYSLSSSSKYGNQAIPLSSSHEFFRTSPAPQFWTLMSHYVPQMNGSACSVASVSMLVNALRDSQKLNSDEPLVTQEALVKRVTHPAWHKGFFQGFSGYAVTLDQLGSIIEESLKAYGLQPKKVEVFHAEGDEQRLRSLIHEKLLEFHKNPRVFLIANFLQGVFTSDSQIGHVSPIGAYDPIQKRVLILDVDREWYEPYWVSEEVFTQGLRTQDPSAHRARGWVLIQVP